ncbi:signal peptidase I [Microbacterium oxydans]|uniref:signal peptidase I n=1 Tax=Microbacterium sp. B19(2022) TaxID=2914045 RepID=UPI001431B7B5|nr:signal peptidase I [Microbacterium sp. B19(2022)]NJI58593.1 signal peptidase I [Microbacterium sp. B19(2022)]
MLHTIYSRTRSILLTIGAIIGAACIVVVLAGVLFKVSPLIVVSGSMEPQIATGSLLLTVERPVGEVAVGDIVTVERTDGHGLVTHRVETVETIDGVITLTLKGDANTLADPVAYTPATVGAYLASIPGLGHAAAFLQTGAGMLIGGAILLAIIALAILDPAKLKGRDEAIDDGASSADSRTAEHEPVS